MGSALSMVTRVSRVEVCCVTAVTMSAKGLSLSWYSRSVRGQTSQSYFCGLLECLMPRRDGRLVSTCMGNPVWAF